MEQSIYNKKRVRRAAMSDGNWIAGNVWVVIEKVSWNELGAVIGKVIDKSVHRTYGEKRRPTKVCVVVEG